MTSVAIVSESALNGFLEADSNANFLHAMTGVNCFAVCCALHALYAVEVLAALLLYVPAVTLNHRAVACMHGTLAGASLLEALLALAGTDVNTCIRSVILALTFFKELCVASSSRRSSTHFGIMDTQSGISDGVAAAVRSAATRYRFASNCLLAAVGIVVHAVVTHESALSASPLTRALARVQNARTSAIVALLASLGAEDSSTLNGRKKAL
jgi:hypothetical protein